ncbi:MAG: DUF6316 family protein [Proteobacteria bacterium]|jgi:hypothetical protein|nr:DUF6316 family protein [Pseudomonadota bacterium]MCG6934411.1 DUF6316 family protein [Pseudomonadota bacterium]
MRDFKLEKQLNRRGEFGAIPLRSRRIYNRGNEWFFVTRNRQRHGPFQHLTEAEAALKLYLRRCGIVRVAI